MDNKKFSTADRLRQIMNERHIRQVDILNFAKPFVCKYGIKLTKTDLSQYVSGKVEPGSDKLGILGLALNVSEAWLMGYDVDEKRKKSEDIVSKYDYSDIKYNLSNDEKELIDYYRKANIDSVYQARADVGIDEVAVPADQNEYTQLSPAERMVAEEYKKRPEMQPAINQILNIQPEAQVLEALKVARNGKPGEKVKIIDPDKIRKLLE